MVNFKSTGQVTLVSQIRQLGRCLELVPLDPNFHDITVGLYEKDAIMTVWTFSCKPGVKKRIKTIRDQLVTLGEMMPVTGTYNQVQYPCQKVHQRATRFLMTRAVEKPVNYSLPEGKVKDLRSSLMLDIKSHEMNGQCVYKVTADGEAPNVSARLRAVNAGFIRYGEMEKIEGNVVGFPCGYRHDQLARMILPYARNIGQVEDLLASDAMRGQMTTGTLGFTPPT